MLWTIFLLLNGLLVVVLLYSTRKRRTNEPPLDKGLLPWLGHALAFGNDAAQFLTRMKDKHGDIFTVRVAGQYVTVLLDPNSFDDILKDSVFLDVSQSRSRMIERVFSLQLSSVQAAAERSWMERHFQGLGLSELKTAMKRNLHDVLLKEHDAHHDRGWKQEGLFSLCYSLLFRAGYLTLFDQRDNAATVYKEFRKFDDLLAKLARCSLKQGERKTANASREKLWELLSPVRLSGGSEPCSWQLSYHHFLQEEGVDTETQNRALLLKLWVTQCNAGPAAFWLIGFLLTHPEAMEAVQSEISGLHLQDSSPQHSTLLRPEAHSTPVFDSVLSETLRLTASVLITREVVQDKILVMANAQKYLLRKGDKVCLFPLLSPQMDPQIHEEPQRFRYDRFLDDGLTVRDHFYKDGQRVAYSTMPWGAGQSCCVGKDFAIAAIKTFVILFLTHLDVQRCDPEAAMPPVKPSRYGFGILQPDGDLQVRYRLKRT